MNNNIWTNISLAERFLRAIAGIIIIFYLLLIPGNTLFFALAYLASLYILLTVLTGWDPLYAIFYKVISLLNMNIKPAQPALENNQFSM